GSAIHTGFALLVAVLLIWYFVGLPPPLVFLAVVPGLLILFLLGVALATVMGILPTHFPDTQHILEILLQALFFLPPVMFPPCTLAGGGRLNLLINWNPFTAVLEIVRRPMLTGEYPEAFHLLQASGFLLLVGLLAWACLRRFERHLVYWI